MTLPNRADTSGIVVLDDQARNGALRLAGASHPGLVRERNEDRLHIDAARGLLIVVDGMGGEAAGEVAADTALAALIEHLERGHGSAEERVRDAIASANNAIERLAREQPEWQGMGCVLTLAVIEDGQVTVGHVGDSRLYRLRAGTIEKMTHDHSPVGMREDQGEISEPDAMRHPRRNEVYRAVGLAPHGPRDAEFMEVLRFPFAREDAILICSDGLTDLVPVGEIDRVVRTHADAERTLVQRLVDAANAAGGKDNVTVAIAAGDRFADDFARDRPSSGPARDEPAPGAPGFWQRRSTNLVIGALAGLALFAAVQWFERRNAPDPGITPELQTRPALRHEVGPGRAFRTIGDALAAARPGDTVAVHPGRYAEAVRLEDGVTLMSVIPGGARIAAPPPADGSSPVAALVAEGIGAGRITGFAIAGEASAPIDYGIVIRRSVVTIENVDVSGAKVAGVSIEDAAGSAVIGSHVHDNPGAGITVKGAGAPTLVQNRVEHNGDSHPARAGGSR